MLTICKKLFDALEDQSVDYCLYKGLDHLSLDLSGEGGDIDILIPVSVASNFDQLVKGLGFSRVRKSSNFPVYYMGRDEQSGSFIMLDVDVDVRFGHKPVRPVSVRPNFDSLSLQKMKFDDVVVSKLACSDYLPLMSLIRLTSKSPSEVQLDEIRTLIKSGHSDPMASYFGKWLQEIDDNILAEFKSSSWLGLQKKFKAKALYVLAGGRLRYYVKRLLGQLNLLEFKRKILRLLGQPPAFAHPGFLVAFVGVDGAGKSSAIDCVRNDEYFKMTGLKRVYFGANEFRTFRVLKLYQWLECHNRLRHLRIFPALIMNFERRLRIIKVLYFRLMGNIVLCDRYYYDDELYRNRTYKSLSDKPIIRLLSRVQMLFMPRVRVRPDLTLFLDVSPDVAYQRKQDFCYKTMTRVNAEYKEMMRQQPGVTFIDADQEQAIVQAIILKKIKALTERV